MKIIKDFPIAITIEDPIRVAENTDKFVNDYIKQYYEGKCFLGCMIEKVIKIVKKSNLILLENNLQGYANINVIFRAHCTVYTLDEPLVFKVKVIQPDKILGGDPSKCVFIKRPNDPTKQLNEIIRVNQYLPCTVMKALYNAFNKNPTIQVKPYVLSKESEYYKLDAAELNAIVSYDSKSKGKPTGQLISYLTISNIIEMITETISYFEKENKDASFKKRYDSIVEAISQKKGLSTSATDYKGAINFYDLIKQHKYKELVGDVKEGQAICYSSDINRVLPLIKIEAHPDEHTFIKTSLEGLVVSLLSKYYMHLSMIRSMLEVFTSDEVMAEHNNLWLFYNKLKSQ